MSAALAVVPKTVLAAPVVGALPVREIVGLKAWLPPTDADPFFGLDRNVAPAGLVSGIALREYYNVTQQRAAANGAAFLEFQRSMVAIAVAMGRAQYEGDDG